MVAVQFARFLGMPSRRRSNVTDTPESVCGVLTDARVGWSSSTSSYISMTTRSGPAVADTLKYFSERIPATFVYAGINVEREGQFDGTRGQQIDGLHPRPHRPAALQHRVAGSGRSPGALLRLRAHKPGSLTGLDRYLHDRTGGMIGSLSHLIRGAALDAIPLDHSSDSN